MPTNAFRLITLGRVALLDGEGRADESLGKRRRKLALLAVLALARRPLGRDRLAEMFWGDEDEVRARHSLSDTLSSLRRVLGPDSIATRQSEVSLSSTCPLTVDAADLLAAAERRDHETVAALYGGVFLEGVAVPGSASFEHWTERVRDQLASVWRDACGHQCLALARARRWDECATLARRWLDADPLDADAALYLLNALKAPGTPEALAAALREYELLEDRLEREHEQTPAQGVAQLAASVRDQIVSTPQIAADFPTTAAPPASTLEVRPASLPVRARRAAFGMASAAFAAMVVITTVLVTRESVAAADIRPTVAVVDVRNVRGDSATAWLEQGLPPMIASDIARIPGLVVVTPEQVRQARRSLGFTPGAALGPDALLRLGRRLGAAWVVSAGIMRGDSIYVLDVSVHDVRGASPPRLYTVTSPSLIALADQAAAHLAGLGDATSGAPGFAELETSSLEAYQHYVRARQAADEGRFEDAKRSLDAAITLDSSFVSALSERVTAAWTDGEQQVVVRLNAALGRALAHASPFDRMRDAAERAMHNGEHARSEALGRALVAAYPRDPRAYALLANLYTMHGRWDAADSVLTHELALDSLATAAGTGPCAPCVAYSGLATLRALRGDMRGAARAAQRWVDLQPDVPGAWSSLAALLSFDGRFDAAIDAHRRAVALAPEAGYGVGLARVLIMARRFDQAEAVIAEMLRSPSRSVRVDALDVRALLERERGQFRQAHRTIDEALATDSSAAVLRLMDANGLSRIGDYAQARATFREQMRPTGGAVAHPAGHADSARAFAWGRALLADAIAGVADTIELVALADSIEIEGGRSYYGRDWRLPHHIRGLIAMRAGDYPRAIRELSAARWGTAGWTVTVVALARAQLALGRATDALHTLRDAYTGPLDAMGRYQPRSEIDYWMSAAFARAGMADSARVYAGYVRTAWRTADPEVFRLLATLPADSSSAVARVVAKR